MGWTVQAFAEIITAVAAIGALIVTFWNNQKIQEVHILINSRLDQLLAASAQAARANGVVQGRKDLQAEHDAAPQRVEVELKVPDKD